MRGPIPILDDREAASTLILASDVLNLFPDYAVDIVTSKLDVHLPERERFSTALLRPRGFQGWGGTVKPIAFNTASRSAACRVVLSSTGWAGGVVVPGR